MVQTSIGNTLAFGKPGEHGNGQPWFADAAIAGEAIPFGAPVVIDGTTMKVKALGNEATACDGILVSPNQHVRQVLPTDTASISCAADDTVCVAKKGSWFIEIKGLSTKPTIKKLVSGVKIATGVWTLTDTAADQYAIVLDYQIFEIPAASSSASATYNVGLLVRIK